MTDPSDALRSFQEVLAEIPLARAELDPDLLVHSEIAGGKPRFSYARLQGQTVTALVIFALYKHIDGAPCFQIGYAVPDAYRGQGLAKSAVRAALAELKNGLEKIGISRFYVEAVIGTDNEASKRVAQATFSDAPDAITDEFSGLPALHYLRKIGKAAC